MQDGTTLSIKAYSLIEEIPVGGDVISLNGEKALVTHFDFKYYFDACSWACCRRWNAWWVLAYWWFSLSCSTRTTKDGSVSTFRCQSTKPINLWQLMTMKKLKTALKAIKTIRIWIWFWINHFFTSIVNVYRILNSIQAPDTTFWVENRPVVSVCFFIVYSPLTANYIKHVI